jgi:hypothetical protein
MPDFCILPFGADGHFITSRGRKLTIHTTFRRMAGRQTLVITEPGHPTALVLVYQREGK